MSDYVKTLVEERAKAVAAAREILDRAAAENRSLDSTEQESVDRAFADVDAKGKMIEDLRALAAREAEVRTAVEGHAEARAETADQAPVVADVDQIRALARGEVRSVMFEKRDVTKASTGSPVPTSFYDEVILLARAAAPVLQVATVLNTAGGENLQIPSLAAYSTAARIAEAGPIGESDPTFNNFVTLGAHKYAFLVQVSQELLEDAGVDVQGLIAANVGNELGFRVGSALTLGTGTVEPSGIVTGAGSAVTGGTGVAGAFTYDNLVDLVYSVDAAARTLPGFAIMASTSAVARMRKLTSPGGDYVWQPSLQAGQPDRVLGYEVLENPSMAAVGTGAISVIAGHMPSYFVRQVGGIRLDRSDDFAFANGLVTFRAQVRIDGALIQSSHVKYFKGGAS